MPLLVFWLFFFLNFIWKSPRDKFNDIVLFFVVFDKTYQVVSSEISWKEKQD